MRKNIGASEGAGIYILGLCGASVFTLILTYAMRARGSYFDSMSIANWVSYALTQLAFIGVVVAYSQIRRVDLPTVARVRKFTNWKQYLLLPLIAIASIMAFLPMSNLFILVLKSIGFNGASVSMPACSNVGIYLLTLLIMAVLPAIGEELLCRGCLLNGLSTRSLWFGILISSLLFSLMHANPLQTVHQFGLGVVLCIVMILSGSIWACVIVHFLNNFISITISAYIPQIDRICVDLGYWNILTGTISVIIGIILLVCLLYLFYRAGSPKKSGYKVVTDGIVYEEFSIYATPETKADDRRYKFSNSTFVGMFKFLGSLFTKNGWRMLTRELRSKNEVVYLGKSQPMFNVWLALGFGVLYWLLAFISGFGIL